MLSRVLVCLALPVSLFPYIIGCASFNTEPEGFGNKTQIISLHDPSLDFQKDKNGKVGLIIPDGTENKMTIHELGAIFKAKFSTADKYGLTFIDPAALSRMAGSAGLRDTLSAIKTNYKRSDASQNLTALGKRLGLTYIFIVDITTTADSDRQVSTTIDSAHNDGDFYWPSFSVLEMQTHGQAVIETKLFSVAQSDFIQTFTANPEITSEYDTSETFFHKRQQITTENQRRREENIQRERIIEEQLANDAKTDHTLMGRVNQALSYPSMYNLSMVPAEIAFKTKKYPEKHSLYTDLYTSGFSTISGLFFARYDGMTVSGETVNGTGTFKFASEDICTGQWINAQADGVCSYIYHNKAQYNGVFANGLAQGTGTFVDPNGNKYEGEFNAGLRDGKGTLYIETTPNEDVYIDITGRVIVGNATLYALRDTVTNAQKLKPKHLYSVIARKGTYTIIREVKPVGNTSKKSSAQPQY